MFDAIGSDSRVRSTAPLKPKTQDLKPEAPKEPVKPRTEPFKDKAALAHKTQRENLYRPEAETKTDDPSWIEGINDTYLDPLGKGDTSKGLYGRYIVETLEGAGTKIGSLLKTAEEFLPVKLFGKALPIVGIVPTYFDVKAAVDIRKDPKAGQTEKDLAAAKAVFSTISTVTGVAAAFTSGTGVGLPVGMALGAISLTFSVAAWATDFAKPKK